MNERVKKNETRDWLWPIIAIIVALLAGAVLVFHVISWKDREMRDDYLDNARLVAQAFDIKKIKELTGTTADIDTPHYQRLKAQLASVKGSDSRCRFVYLTGQRTDGRVFFYADSEPIGSADESPSGQIYDEITQDELKAFDQKRAIIVGPVTDRWGRWISAVVPLTDPKTERLIAMLGMDIDADDWNSILVKSAIAPSIFILAAITVILMFVSLLNYRAKLDRPSRLLSNMELIFIAVMGLVLTMLISYIIRDREALDHRKAFRQVASIKTGAVAEMICDLERNQIEGLASFCSGQDHIEVKDFNHYAEYLLGNRLVHAWEWIQVVTDSEKPMFEERYKSSGFSDFSIWKKDEDGNRAPSIGQKVYYPVASVMPSEDSQHLLGHDLGSEPAILKTLEDTASMALIASTGPDTFFHGDETKKGIFVLRPVFSRVTQGELRGYATAFIRAEAFARNLSSETPVILEISMLNPKGEPMPLTNSHAQDDTAFDARFVIIRPFFAFGNVFSITAYASPDFLKLHTSSISKAFLVMGVIITFALIMIINLFVFKRDIAARKIMEEQLRQSNEKLRFIMDSVKAGVVLIVPDTFRIIDINQAACEMIGSPKETLINQVCHNHICSAEKGKCPIVDLGQEVDNSERIILTSDGSRLPVIKTVTRINLGGKIYLLESFVDISSLKKEQERLSNVIEGTHAGTWEWNVQSGEIRINKICAEIIGYSIDELANLDYRTMVKLMHPDDRHRSAEIIEAHLNGDSPFYDNEYRMQHKDGHWVWIQVRGRVMTRTSDGRPLMMFGTHMDITPMKEVEEALVETNELLSGATEQAEKMAEEAKEANIAKGEFLANMSHEIRTPMNGVIGMADLLMTTTLTEEQRGYLKTIQNSGNALLAIINDILDYSKIEAGRLELEIIDFDLSALIDEINDLMALRAQEKGLEYLSVIDPEVPLLLKGDPVRLRQILINLVGNSIKFTEKGEITIAVSLEMENQSDVNVRFRIIDTGIGIPEDKQHKIFESFSQADGSTTRKYGGTGLGLAICKQLVSLMGGEIGVESAQLKGATFWFTARFIKPHGEHILKEPGNPELKCKRALIVDDNSASREILKKYLKSWGCRFGEASDGFAALNGLALASADKDPYNIVLIDMDMAEMKGEELAQRIRENHMFNDAILIMLTPLTQPRDALEMDKYGFAARLNKPVKKIQLFNCLCSLSGKDGEKIKNLDKEDGHIEKISAQRKGEFKILLAEDDATNQRVARGILDKLGYPLDIVSNGREAIDALKKGHYDLVLMDCQMPEMDGYEATGRLRNPESGVINRNIPVIAMTAHAMTGDRERCLAAGMDDYINKPIKMDSMSAILSKWLLKNDDAKRDERAETVNAPVDSVFNRDALMKRLGFDDELAESIIAGFLEDIPEQIQRLEELIAQGESEEAGYQSHRIKGAAASIEGGALKALAYEMEKAGKSGDIDGLKKLFSELKNQFEILKKRMENR